MNSQSKEFEIEKIKKLVEKYQEEINQLNTVIEALKEKECSLIRQLPNIFVSDKTLHKAWREFHGYDEDTKHLNCVKEIIFEYFEDRENLKIINFLMVGLDDRACSIRIIYKNKSFSIEIPFFASADVYNLQNFNNGKYVARYEQDNCVWVAIAKSYDFNDIVTAIKER